MSGSRAQAEAHHARAVDVALADDVAAAAAARAKQAPVGASSAAAAAGAAASSTSSAHERVSALAAGRPLPELLGMLAQAATSLERLQRTADDDAALDAAFLTSSAVVGEGSGAAGAAALPTRGQALAGECAAQMRELDAAVARLVGLRGAAVGGRGDATR